MDPGFGTGFSALVVSRQAVVTHEPAESSLHYPPPRKNDKALHVIRALNNLNNEAFIMLSDPIGECIARIASIDPKLSKSREPTGHPTEHGMASVPLCAIRRSDHRAKHQAKGIHQQVPFPAFDPLGCVVSDFTSVTVGFDALAVQNSCTWLIVPAFLPTNTGPEAIVERDPNVITRPLSENMIDGLPRGEGRGQQAPLHTALQYVDDRVHHHSRVSARPASLCGFGNHRLQELPLGVGEIGFVNGVFQRPRDRLRRLTNRVLLCGMSIRICGFPLNLASAAPGIYTISGRSPIFRQTLSRNDSDLEQEDTEERSAGNAGPSLSFLCELCELLFKNCIVPAKSLPPSGPPLARLTDPRDPTQLSIKRLICRKSRSGNEASASDLHRRTGAETSGRVFSSRPPWQCGHASAYW